MMHQDRLIQGLGYEDQEDAWSIFSKYVTNCRA